MLRHLQCACRADTPVPLLTPGSLPPSKVAALTSGCSPAWWHCQALSDGFQVGRSTSWGAHTGPRGPTAAPGGSYNGPHSHPAPRSLLAPRSFNHTQGHAPRTPGPQDTGQLGTETQTGHGYSHCCSAHPSGPPPPMPTICQDQRSSWGPSPPPTPLQSSWIPSKLGGGDRGLGAWLS